MTTLQEALDQLDQAFRFLAGYVDAVAEISEENQTETNKFLDAAALKWARGAGLDVRQILDPDGYIPNSEEPVLDTQRVRFAKNALLYAHLMRQKAKMYGRLPELVELMGGGDEKDK